MLAKLYVGATVPQGHTNFTKFTNLLSLQPNPKHYDEENQIRLELIGYDRPDVHQIIAWRYIHIYDIIKVLHIGSSVEETRNLN